MNVGEDQNPSDEKDTPVPQRDSSIHGQSEPRLKPMVTFTLVHGTFNTKADWVNDDADQHSFRSRMRDELSESNDVRFDVVSWGDVGRVRRLLDNTDACRLSGVRKLQNISSIARTSVK